jgi:hypothetical protein
MRSLDEVLFLLLDSRKISLPMGKNTDPGIYPEPKPENDVLSFRAV